MSSAPDPTPVPEHTQELTRANARLSAEVAARQAAERELQRQLQLFRTLVDAIPDCIYIKDTHGRYLAHNAANRRLLALASGDHGTGRTVHDFPATQANAAAYTADDRAVLASGQPVLNREEPFTQPDGSPGWFLTTKVPVRDEHGVVTGIVGVSRDITIHRHEQQALAASEARFRVLFESSPDAIFVERRDGLVLDANPAACRLQGMTRAELLGKHVTDLVPPARRAEVRRRFADLFTQATSIIESESYTLDGRVIPVELAACPCEYAGQVAALIHVRDISDRRRAEAERQQLELKLQETQKLESLGVLAGGIAHDFNNLLTGILGNASLARLDLPPSSPIQRSLDRIEQTSLRAADLCKQMLAYAGKGRFVVQPTDLTQLVHDTAHLLHVSISKKAALNFALAPALPPVLADASQLRQIVMNLVINASEAIGDHPGTITLTTGLVRADAPWLADAQPVGNFPLGDYVSLEVSDTGCGMTPEVRARIFEPFYTTKFTGRGLGLAAVLGIVRGHGGALKIQSEPGRGSTFQLLLPIAPGVAVAEPVPGGPTAPGWRGTGQVLVVDDEETVRTVVARVLESLGFTVTLAADGREAVAIFAALPDAFALVVMDLTMPHMDGVEAIAELHRLRPAQRVMLMSGYSEHDLAATFADRGVAGFLQKPFELPTLRDKIRAVFEPGPA